MSHEGTYVQMYIRTCRELTFQELREQERTVHHDVRSLLLEPTNSKNGDRRARQEEEQTAFIKKGLTMAYVGAFNQTR